jgi:hypothetical protein
MIFTEPIEKFEGSSKRLQKLSENENGTAYLDLPILLRKLKQPWRQYNQGIPGRLL